MAFENERHLESYIRNLIEKNICSENPSIMLLKNKKAVDILICKNNPNPELFFLEIKYHINTHGRLGFGSSSGGGFQPEILLRRPDYFENNLRWILAIENNNQFFFLSNKEILEYISGDKIGEKFNNIKKKLFVEMPSFTEAELVRELQRWILKK